MTRVRPLNSSLVATATALILVACAARDRRASGGDGGDGGDGGAEATRAATTGGSSAPTGPIGAYDPARDCPASSGKTFEVGPGQKLEAIGDVPWETLGKGDRVLIHARPQPYREHIVFGAIGTADAPVRVCGVPDGAGKLPVISGDGGTTRSKVPLRHPAVLERGLVVLTLLGDMRWGQKPAHIQLSGLEIRDAHPSSGSFTDPAGKEHRFRENAAAVFVERGEHISVTHCVLTNSGNGFFVASGDMQEMMSRDIALRASYVYGNGVDGSYRMHNSYTEAIGMLYEGNRFGPLRSGAIGTAIKDRSAGTVVRYNWIEGGALLLDLVDAEDSSPITGKDPRYHRVFVYGNVMISDPSTSSSLVHFGGDTGMRENFRNGPLYFFHNTVVIRANEAERYFTSVLRLETNRQKAVVLNNVFRVDGTTRPTWLKYGGDVTLGRNWTDREFADFKKAEDGASVAGQDSVVVGGAEPFADATSMRPSPAMTRHSASALPAEVTADHAPQRQYRPHLQTVSRPTASRLGAFE